MLRNKVMKEIRLSKANFFINIIGEAKGNSNLIWGILKNLTGKYHSNIAKRLEIMVNNNLTQDAAKIAIAFNSYPSPGYLGSVQENDAKPVFIISHLYTSDAADE